MNTALEIAEVMIAEGQPLPLDLVADLLEQGIDVYALENGDDADHRAFDCAI